MQTCGTRSETTTIRSRTLVSARIVLFAQEHEASILVFEHLGNLKPEKGKYSRRGNQKRAFWMKGRIFKYTKYKAYNVGILTSRVSPRIRAVLVQNVALQLHAIVREKSQRVIRWVLHYASVPTVLCKAMQISMPVCRSARSSLPAMGSSSRKSLKLFRRRKGKSNLQVLLLSKTPKFRA